ncbi:MAG: dephospho-CoA kinase [Candidatus Pelagibacter sp. TMED197]|nr:dephospho-CoA kinase [Candidatus Pelagibacter sp.]OUW58624.1 MAG: dephospho-CoA kinase [Candidatus Pelagibacter sp. TMED197]
MIKIGLTGSIASGKTTASKIISRYNGPLFSADKIVKKLYEQSKFRLIISKTFKLDINVNLKLQIKNKIKNDKNILKRLEKIIHPFVRKEMHFFVKKYKNQKILFFEIPLLIESKLMNFFDTIIFIKSKKNLRLKRYKLKGGNEYFFNLLNNHQLKDVKKTKFCDHIVVNNGSILVLKKKLRNIIKIYA